MHGTTPTLAYARFLREQFGEKAVKRDTLGNRMTVTAMGGTNGVRSIEGTS
jgi:hypothetical protein